MDYLELLMAVSGCQLDHETVRANHYIGKLDNWNCWWLSLDHDTVRGEQYTGKLGYLELLVAVSGCQADHDTVRGEQYTGKLGYFELLVAVSGCHSDHDTVRFCIVE